MYMPGSRRTLFVAAVVAVAGCSGTTSSPSLAPGSQNLSAFPVVHHGMPFVPALRQSAHPSVTGHYRTERSLVFEGDQTQVAVNIYQTRDLPSNPAPVASIKVGAGCPYGTATDYTGTLYVADNCGGSDVEEYPEGRTAMKTKITTGISNPLGAAIDPSGTLYVSNYPAAITIYPYGTTSPSQTITGGGLTDPFGLALDGSGNLYIADFGASQVFELLKGSSGVIPLNLQNLTEPLGVAVDIKHGYLWVTDGSGNKINVYQLGSTTPFQTIAGTGFPYAISTQERGAHAGYVIYSDLNTHAVYAFKPGQYTPYAQLTTGITQPTGLLLTQP